MQRKQKIQAQIQSNQSSNNNSNTIFDYLKFVSFPLTIDKVILSNLQL